MHQVLRIMIVACLFAWAGKVQAQQADSLLKVKKEYATPSVVGQGKSKGVRIRYEVIPHFDISSDGKQGVPDSESEIRRNNKFELRLFAPIFNRPTFKMVVGFHHDFEEFNFKRKVPLNYPFYINLEDKNLRSIGGQIVMLRPLDEVNFIVFRVKSELNGDYTNARLRFGDYLKTSVEGVYGWKKNPNLTYGIALQLGYTYGRRRIYPAFLYNRTFNEKWGVEALFPANLFVRRNMSERSLFFAGYELDGASYNINVDSPPFSGFETVELRKTELRPLVRWEREIYDFLWFGIEAGYRYNFRFNVYDGETRIAEPIIENKLKGTGFFNFEIFLVPPRRFLKQ